MARVAPALLLVLLAAAFAAPAAQAAYLIAAPPTYTQSGAGPFEWQIRTSSAGSSTGAVAYKLSTESVWHRCNKDLPARMSNLPEGAYSVSIADDISLEWYASRGILYSGFTQPCFDSPTTYAPQTLPTTTMLYVDATAPTVSTPAVITAGLDSLVSVDASDDVAGIASIEWSAGDGYTASGQTYMRHAYLFAGTWTGSVTVTDRGGNRTTRPYTVVVAPAATPQTGPRPVTPTPTPTPVPDTAAPELRVSAPARQRLRANRAAAISVRCSERCGVTTTGVLTVGTHRYALRSSSGTLQAQTAGSFRLTLSVSARRALDRAAHRRQHATAVIRVTAADVAGNRATKTVRISAV